MLRRLVLPAIERGLLVNTSHLPNVGAAASRWNDIESSRSRKCVPCRSFVRACSTSSVKQHCFEIKQLEGRGLGAIALEDLKSGKIVLADPPVLAVRTDEPGDAWNRELHSEFEKLGDENKKVVWDLHDVCLNSKEKTLEGILFSNCIGRDMARFDVALLPLVSRFNHSCSPNLEQSWDEDAGEAHLIAAEEIPAGEELTISYIELRLPREERRQRLRENYGFECHCSACSRPDVEASDNRRTQLKRLDDEIRTAGSTKDPHRALKEGLHLWSRQKWNCLSAVEFAAKGGDFIAAMKWARRGVECSKMGHGPNHRDTKFLKTIAKDPNMHPTLLAQKNERDQMVFNAAATGVLLVIVYFVYQATFSAKQAANQDGQP
eukprot:TRINITY_DN10547_c0_g1_i2.p1 TRINITY_DN10547_c0_g1~~TRINITY_DN10547_c0_g1_i2.p1  ORF type:complete len:377 (-),score=63.87 TRINITY_DN10547_c0_g1_i2:69-1199(-)